ncbi:uncharacterized protein TNCV_2078901 [Trichonephila clavipes]|nr:uncharacterized protein TNCV_2078901 [Trichonephila clavipes]
MPSIGGYHPYGLASILTGLESNRAWVRYAWSTNCSPSTPSHLSTGTSEGIDEWCNIPQDQIDNLILSMPRHCYRRRKQKVLYPMAAHTITLGMGPVLRYRICFPRCHQLWMCPS